MIQVRTASGLVRHITFKPSVDDPSVVRQWAEKCRVVCISGDELERVLERFTGLPMITGKQTMEWYGDHAKFILGNWS